MESVFAGGGIDTRCANPEYQLDVDIMMLEYTVHHAVVAKLAWLEAMVALLSQHAEDNPDNDDNNTNNSDNDPSALHAADQLREKAGRLSIMFDHQISLIRLNHPSARYTPGCEYNIKILQFLILLEHWISVSSRTQLGSGSNWMFPDESRPDYQYPPRIPQQLVQQFHQERLIETVFRRNWLDIRYADEQIESGDGQERSRKRRRIDDDSDIMPIASKSNKYDEDESEDTGDSEDDDDNNVSSGGSTASDDSNQPSEQPLDPPNQEKPCLNVGISSGGRSNRRLKVAARSDEVKGYLKYHKLFSITLFELIPRFMDLSADISQILGDINNSWVELASDFMWQSALERLQQMPSNRYTKPSRTPFKMIRDDFGMRTWIEECFAWGWPQSVTKPDRSTKSKGKGRFRILPSQTSLARLEKELELLNARPESNEYLVKKLEAEDEIARMFLLRTGDDDNDGDPHDVKDADDDDDERKRREPQQHVKFTTHRNHHLNTLLDLIVEERPISQHVPFNMTTRRYCEASPIKPFITRLLAYLTSIFTANMSSEISGQPVLVQIENGSKRIEGLVDEDEYAGFLARVGLDKMSKSRRRKGISLGGIQKGTAE